MIKKLMAPSNNRSESVLLILRGAKRRRAIAYSNAAEVNSNSGVRPNLRAVK